MGRFFKKLGMSIIILVVLFAILFGALAAPAPRRSFPQVDGELQLLGLDAPVDIYRDTYGIPHIYASTTHDLFFAQGYVHAQDRFWQMDFWRHQGAGRLSELLGKSTVDTDKFLKTLGWERLAQQEFEQLADEPRAILDAYSAGVNAYLADHTGTALSLEYGVLPLINRGYTPKPWTPINSMTWAKAMAWDLRGNIGTEIDRAMLLKTLTAEQVDQLFPPYPNDRPVIVNHPHITSLSYNPESGNQALIRAAYPAFAQIDQRFDALDAIAGGGVEGIGSNNWVIAGERTTTGLPFLANDPHLSAQMPSIWYEVGLHCEPVSIACPLEVRGFSFAGVPGVVIGHNANIAWGMTNVGPDVMDLYIEKINPANPNQYEYQGEWVDMEIIQDVVQVAGGDPQPLEVRLTRHGPIITEVFDLEDFAQEAGIALPADFAIALRWTALEPSCIFCAIWKFNTARNWDEFRDATREFAVPAQNLVYADTDGNIGYQTPGNIPIRSSQHDGMQPVPGWTGEYEWQGYIPFEDLPYAFNPPEGYIVTANNAVVGQDYPYIISRQWDYGLRAQRIVGLLEDAPGLIDAQYIARMQGDNMDLNAAVLLPVLQTVPLGNTELEAMRALFDGWDYQFDMQSAPAALFAAFWKHLLLEIFQDDLPDFYQPETGSRWTEIVRRLLDTPESLWWDDHQTPEVETRDTIFARAFGAAVTELQDEMGKDPAGWAWGDLHTLTFYNQVMNNVPLVGSAFNRGPFPTAGGKTVVNATGWELDKGYTVNWLPSMRMIVDMSNLQASLTVHTTGQSGHAYHEHYIDMADPWRLVQYHPMHWSRDAILADFEGHLQLTP